MVSHTSPRTSSPHHPVWLYNPCRLQQGNKYGSSTAKKYPKPLSQLLLSQKLQIIPPRYWMIIPELLYITCLSFWLAFFSYDILHSFPSLSPQTLSSTLPDLFLYVILSAAKKKHILERNITFSKPFPVLLFFLGPHELLFPAKSFLQKLALSFYSVFSISAALMVCITPLAPLKCGLLLLFICWCLFPISPIRWWVPS